MLRYQWTPFQLLAIVALTLAIFDFVALSKMKSEPGLGGLAPYIYMAFSIGFVIFDLLFQYLFRKFKQAFYICEVIFCLAFVVWIYNFGGI